MKFFCSYRMQETITAETTSPTDLVRIARTEISLFTRSTMPATDAITSSLSTYVPCPLVLANETSLLAYISRGLISLTA